MLKRYAFFGQTFVVGCWIVSGTMKQLSLARSISTYSPFFVAGRVGAESPHV